ncbi:hypothetical protein [Actinoplanes sp. NPDC023714]|uniref:hypothetical protein n=1 Tax=Actinoplanes sp. NPDC023714 TaxID=3154322 RepID=UPI0033E4358B
MVNAGLVVAGCVLAGPSLLPAGEAWLSGVVLAIILLLPMRLLSVLLEVYLLRRGRQISVVTSHVAGLVVGGVAGATPSAPPVATGTATAGGWGVGLFAYACVTLAGLGVGAVVALIRASVRGDERVTHDAGFRWALSSISAVFWFNMVFLLAVALLITPGLVSLEPEDYTAGFLAALILCALLRLPGMWSEWWLTKRGWHRAVYGVHIGAGILVGLVAVLIVLDRDPDQAWTHADTVGASITFYLILSSATLLLAVPVVAAVRYRSRRLRLGEEGPTTPAAPPIVYRGTARVPEPVTMALHLGAVAESTAEVPEVPHTGRADHAEKSRNEIAVALGIVVGLASLVQGYDSADPFRTVVVAIAIGLIGLGVLYGITVRRK